MSLVGLWCGGGTEEEVGNECCDSHEPFAILVCQLMMDVTHLLVAQKGVAGPPYCVVVKIKSSIRLGPRISVAGEMMVSTRTNKGR